MVDGLTFEIRGRKFVVDPEERLRAGHAPVLVVAGTTTEIEEFLSGLPSEVSYDDGPVVRITPVAVIDEQSAQVAEYACRTVRSQGRMAVIGLNVSSPGLWDPFHRWALWTFDL